MTLARKQQIKADEYRVQALGALALADASVLAQVRDMHLAAAAAWTEMAEQQDRAVAESGRRLAALNNARPARTPKPSPEGTPMPSFTLDPVVTS